ncbi:MAG: exonuclease domain-containing protein [Clostridiales bacterium]|nr:exonuclease domain-containing protein [Clostridiales bacterium]
MAAAGAKEYVIVDVETTGLDAAADELIEIAAVKVRRGLIVEDFSTFVKAEQPIPPYISNLTGIYDEMLEQAPSPRQAIDMLAAFIGTADIAAHNASFDSAFIHRYWPDKREWLDTIALLQAAFPCAPSYSLANLCEYLQIENERAHRALADARATAALFLRARKQLAALPPKAKEDMLLLAAAIDSPLENIVRRQCASKGAALPEEEAGATPDKPATRANDTDYRIPLEDIRGYFAPDGLYRQRIEGFEYREAQLKMAERVAESLNGEGFLLAEAGTGTGKSLAYLLPAALYALNSGQRVAVSTYTKNLQEQLLHKDIPLLEQLLQRPVNAVVLKGRANYLCRRLYRAQLRQPGENMRAFLLRVAAWLPGSSGGDGGELNLNSHDKWRWQRICASGENCDAACPNFKGSCFVGKARREADKADIFILNHALLLANAALENGFLPALPKLIIDEAHRLEHAAEEQFTARADNYGIQFLLSRLRRGRGGLPELLMRQAEAFISLETQRESLQRRVAALYDTAEQAGRQSEQFFGLLNQEFTAEAFTDPYLPARLRLLPGHRRLSAWQDILSMGASLTGLLLSLRRECLAYSDALYELAQGNDSEMNGREELLYTAMSCEDICGTIEKCLATPGEGEAVNTVCWLEFMSKDKMPGLNIAPIEVGGLLKDNLYEHTQSLVLTSATMTTGEGSFCYFKQRLGLDTQENEPEELVLPSPFFYNEQALFTVCTGLPEWSKTAQATASEALAGALFTLLGASRGRALVLFTSHAQLKAVYELLRAPLAEQGITVLAHGVSGEPSLLLNRLTREPRCCILGAASFWEGVDVLGSALSMVVMVRLPFWPPNTPTVAAKMERIEAAGGAGFYEYSLPQAVLRFKQGFGRLIRSVEDTGVFCVLDKRILQKSYGRLFIKALPDMKRLSGNAAELSSEIKRWLK